MLDLCNTLRLREAFSSRANLPVSVKVPSLTKNARRGWPVSALHHV